MMSKKDVIIMCLVVFGSFLGSMLATFYFTSYQCTQFFIPEEEVEDEL